MKAIVVIPVYKEQLSTDEERSFRQCIRVLGKHPICLVCPASLNRSVYDCIFQEESAQQADNGQTYPLLYLTECFDEEYFKSQRGYNRLMLSPAFYQRFAQWDYMLIHQLDAYVFEDQLEVWCQKGYDYIGAPFQKINQTIDWINCGNGGFSLRRIQRFIDFFQYQGKLLTIKGLWRFHRYRGSLHRLPLCISGALGKHNYIKDYLSQERLNEDLIFSMLGDSHLKWNIPDSRTAMYFSFEEKPSYLFSITGRLPFGCHAFRKNEYDTFYKPLLEKCGSSALEGAQSMNQLKNKQV